MYHNVHQAVDHLRKAPRIRPGGLCSIAFALHRQVAAWPEVNPETGIIDDEIQLVPGAILYTIEATDKGRSFEEVQKRSAAGAYMDISVNGIIGGNTTNNTLIASAMMHERFVVIVKDRNGEYRLIGNEDSGAKFSYSYSSGDRDASRLVNIGFTWQHPLPAPIYQGVVINYLTENMSFMFLTAFKVKDAGTPMTTGQSSWTSGALVNKKPFVLLNQAKVPSEVNDMEGEMYIDKPIGSDTLTFKSNELPVGLNENDIVEIYAHTP